MGVYFGTYVAVRDQHVIKNTPNTERIVRTASWDYSSRTGKAAPVLGGNEHPRGNCEQTGSACRHCAGWRAGALHGRIKPDPAGNGGGSRRKHHSIVQCPVRVVGT
ncbi:hypothetical protein CVCC1112_2111 [Paenarthrobacter nicotinovorans]|nr:hypothetical protein CVCC1112_2111 [Paenarthrobacter nicotinovorans]